MICPVKKANFDNKTEQTSFMFVQSLEMGSVSYVRYFEYRVGLMRNKLARESMVNDAGS